MKWLKKPDLQNALMEFNSDYPDWYSWKNIADGEVYSNVKVIKEGAILPTENQVNLKLKELISEYDNERLDYKLKRIEAYPPLEDQLDYIFHNGLDAWKTDIIKPIKDKHPKPE